MSRFIILLALIWPALAQAALPVGEILKPVSLSGDKGGLVNGGAWSPEAQRGKVWTLFYVDPDEKDLNEEAVNILSAIPRVPEVASVAVINLAATWLPNSLINPKLVDSQKKHPSTIYVKDLDKTLVNVWGLGDNTYSISLIGPDLKVLYSHDGKLDQKEIQLLLSRLKGAVATLKAAQTNQSTPETNTPL